MSPQFDPTGDPPKTTPGQTPNALTQFAGEWEPVAESNNTNAKNHEGALIIRRTTDDSLIAKANYTLEVVNPRVSQIYGQGTLVYSGTADRAILLPVKHLSKISLRIKGQFEKKQRIYRTNGSLGETDVYKTFTAQLDATSDDEIVMLIKDNNLSDSIRFLRK